MSERNEEEREQLKEERDLLKEEKRRAAEQKRLEAESAARRAAVRNAVVSAVSGASAAAKSAAEKTADVAGTVNKNGRKTLSSGKLAGQKAYAVFSEFCVKVWSAVTAFAERRGSVPVFILLALASYVGITCISGYKLFGLTALPPTFQF